MFNLAPPAENVYTLAHAKKTSSAHHNNSRRIGAEAVNVNGMRGGAVTWKDVSQSATGFEHQFACPHLSASYRRLYVVASRADAETAH